MRKKKRKNTEKHIYSPSLIVYSAGWRIEDYRLADKQRQIERDQRKQADSLTVGCIFDVLNDLKCFSVSAFTDIIFRNYPQYIEVYLHHFNTFRDYIRDKADYNAYFKEIQNDYDSRVEVLEKKYQNAFEDQHFEYVELLKFLRSQRDDLIDYINQIERSQVQIDALNEIYSSWLQAAGLTSKVDSFFQEFEDSETREIAYIDSVGLNDNDVPY